MSVAPTLRCPCGEGHVADAFHYDAAPDGETKFDLGGQTYVRSYVQCGICEHMFSRHQIDLSGLYDRSYVDATYHGAAGMRAKFSKIMALAPHQSDNAGRVVRVRSFADRLWKDARTTRTLLDVGAGLGVFPAAMRAAGWSVTAIEPDPRTVDHLREVAGVQAICGDLFDVDSRDMGGFDAVTFNKVLEHVEDPVPLLARAGSMLSRGGFCYVEVPDVLAAAEGPRREEFFIEHHHVFSSASLAMIARRAELVALAIERIREPSGKFTVFGFFGKPRE